MSRPLPMLENILAQPGSHRAVLDLSTGSQKQKLAACAALLRKAQSSIVFSGMGASLFAALPAVSRLQQHGYRVHAAESAELLHYSAATLKPGDVGVLISRSGGSVEVLRLAASMRAAGVSVVGITNVPGSPLEEVADACLLIGAQPDQLVAVQTYTGTVLFLLLLAEQVLAGDTAMLTDAALTLLPVLTDCIEQSLQASTDWQPFFDAPEPLYLLGRGPALASAHEGALLFHETAKASAVAMSSGQFRHGPVEVVSSRFKAVIFGAPPSTRDMDRSLAADLVKMGGAVRWIGPAANEFSSVPTLIPWPAFGSDAIHASVLAPLVEIVPLQVAAYRLALWRGLTPGDFRFASEVTSEESGFPLLQSRLSRA